MVSGAVTLYYGLLSAMALSLVWLLLFRAMVGFGVSGGTQAYVFFIFCSDRPFSETHAIDNFITCEVECNRQEITVGKQSDEVPHHRQLYCAHAILIGSSDEYKTHSNLLPD